MAKLEKEQLTKRTEQQISKCLGKLRMSLDNPSQTSLCNVAIFVVLTTGCRPKEGAHIVFNKSIRDNDYIVKHMTHRLQSFMPMSVTKTKYDYLWLLPDEFGDVFEAILKLGSTGFNTWKELWKSSKPYYTKQVLEKAGVTTRYSARKLFSMRTARAKRASDWILVNEEYKLMKWEPRPLNPLQHETEKMTIEHYAKRGSLNVWETQRRCI